MSAFTGPLKVEFSNAKERRIILLEDLVWEIDIIGSGNIVVIPTGFESDGMTIPRILWWWIPPLGHSATRPSVLHDYLLSLWKNHSDKYTFLTKKFCDKQLYLALLACGVSKITSTICYYAVRIFSLMKYGE